MKKKLLLLMLAILVIVGWPSVASAYIVQGFENGSFPSGWYSPGNGFSVVNYHAYDGNYCLRGDKDAYLVLSSGNSPISDMVLEMYVKNASQSNQSMAHLYIGYVTNPNDMSTFHCVSPVFFQSDYTWVRVGFAGAPAGARVAIYSYCYQPQYNQLAYSWYIDEVVFCDELTRLFAYGNYVNENERAYIEGFENYDDGVLPHGWLYDVSSQPATFTTGSTNPLSGSKCLKGKGYVILPKATGVETNHVMVDLFVNKNSTASASMQIGYVTNTNDMSTFVPVRTLIHQTGYRYARVDFAGAPAGARIAIRTTGNTEWYIDNLYMFDRTELNPSFVYQFNQGFEQVTLNFVDRLPRGWTYLSDDGLSPFWTINTNPHNGQYSLRGTDGYLVLPPSELNLSSYSMDYWLAANQWQGGFDYFEAGYMTDPDDVNTFVSLEIVLEDITDFKFHRVNFDGVPSGARIAFHIYASNPSLYMTWYLDDISVYQTPQVQYLPYSENFTGQTSGDILPQGWIDNGTCSVTSDKRLSAVGDAKVSMLKMVTGGTVQWDLMAKPVTAQSSGSFSLGYVTTQNMKDFDFHSVKTFNNKSSWTDFQPRSVLFTIPAGAYPAIQTVSSNWLFDNIHIYQPTIKTLPLTEGFENLDGGLPSGWLGESAYTSGSDNMGDPLNGSKKLNLGSLGYVALPQISVNSYANVYLDLWLMPSYTHDGSQIHVGYMTDPNDRSTFHSLQYFTSSTSWSSYQKKTVSLSGIPAGARIALKIATNPWWLIDDIRVYSAVEMPYSQGFAGNSLPEGWGRYTGRLQWNSSTLTGTATLTSSDYSWSFGQQNGVFDSHAYASIGGNNAQYKWLVSPSIHLDNQDDPYVTFTLGMSRAQGTQAPLSYGAQSHERVGVYLTDDDGVTWHFLAIWGPGSSNRPIEQLHPDGQVYPWNIGDYLTNYKNKIIRVGFYAECTDASDALNNVHLDDFSVQHYDLTAPAQSVTVSEVASHSAKVSWVVPNYVQWYWDVWVAESFYTPSNNITTSYMQQNGHYYSYGPSWNHFSQTVTGLTAGQTYKAWVRYHSASTVGEWLSSTAFTTVANCAPPTDVSVYATSNSAYISWAPGQSNQTSWYIYVEDYHDMDGETLNVPYFIIEDGLEPRTEYSAQITGYCEDDDGDSQTVSVTFTTSDTPHITINEVANDLDDVPISDVGCDENDFISQFIIPASSLTDIQYSTIDELVFYNGHWTHTPWGNATYTVKLMEVSQSSFPPGTAGEDLFYEFKNSGNLHVFTENRYMSIDSDGTMRVSCDWNSAFEYHDGNLLVLFVQTSEGTNFSHADWIGQRTTSVYSSMIQNPGYDPVGITFLPKVSLYYTPEPYLPPTNFQAYVTGGYDVSFSWTMRDGQTATEIGICVSPDFIGDQTLTNSTDSQCGVSFPNFFEPEETYYYRYRGLYEENGETHYSGWSLTGSFTMPDACEKPTNLQATDVTESSVHFSWNHNSEYDELEYREIDDYVYETLVNQGFENGLPTDWITQTNGSGNGWTIMNRANQSHSGSYFLGSTHIKDEDPVNNWVILPVDNLHGILSFYAKKSNSYNSYLRVYVSTTGTSNSNFQQVASITPLTTSYQYFTVDLTQYPSRPGYIAFRHYTASNVTAALTVQIDDVVFRSQTEEWSEIGTSTVGQLNLLGLTPGTTYQARVKSHCNTGYTSDWSAPVSFTTLNNIVFEDANVKARCLSAWDGILGDDPDGELSYAEAAAVTDLGTAFYEATDITSFNELQYFTGLTAIRQDAFRGCSSLSAVTLPNTITTIGYNAFGSNGQSVGCTNLTSILIPQGVTSIQEYAFQHSGLTEISFPPSVTTISFLAFGYCDDLTTVYLPATVTTLSGNAFTGASLASIEVDPDNPVYDSRNSCNAIIETATNTLKTGCMNTVIPEGVTTLGTSCFEEGSGLTSLTLPASVSEIKDYAFAGCSHLVSLKVLATTPPILNEDALVGITPANIKVFVPCGSFEAYENSDWSAFNLVEDCNIVFADYQVEDLCVANWDIDGDGGLSYSEAAAVTSLGTVFRENMSIWSFNELQYFTGLTVLDGYAFFRCFTLVSVTLPPTMTTISNHAFYFCPLTALTIPESVTTIGNYAFGATNLASLDIPATVTEIGMNPVIHCSALSTLTVAASNPVYSDGGGNAIIETATHKLISGCQSTVIPEDVTTIGANAFAMLNTLTSVTLPASVASIEIGAFCYSPNIARIFVDATTPPVMTDDAFYGVSKDIPVYVPCNSLGYYEDDDYWGLFTNILSDCEYINFADANVKAICVANWDTDGDGELSYREAALVTTLNVTGDDCASVFKSNTTITSFDELQYFTGLTTIDPYAFFNCFDLASVTLPSTLVTLGRYCFENCTSLTSVEIPNSVTVIDDGVFFGCSGITSMEIPPLVTELRAWSFSGTGLTSVYVPYWVNYIDQNPFAECLDLVSITVDPDNTVYDSRGDCNAIIETNTNSLLTGCVNTVIPDDVTKIAIYAFAGCTGLTSVTFPGSVTVIQSYSFENCDGLTRITVESVTPPLLQNDAFLWVSTDVPVIVPCGSQAAYQSATNWSAFTHISGDCIVFADPDVKAICVANWDTDGDGELSHAEAAAVTSLSPSGQSNQSVFTDRLDVDSFDELQYFTGLTQIRGYAFYGCSNMTSIVLPAGITEIWYHAFENCTSLQGIQLPEQLNWLGSRAFFHCSGLTGGLRIPGTVTRVQAQAFHGCTGLTSLMLESGVSEIEGDAFYNCLGLKQIWVDPCTPPTLDDSFDHVDPDVRVYVPCLCLDNYLDYNSTGQPWGGFANILGQGCDSEEQTLAAGWNWFAPMRHYMVSELETALGDHAVLINTQDGGFARYENGSWSGTLQGDLLPGRMLKILNQSSVTLSLYGPMFTRVTVSIEPGANWIGYTGPDNPIEEALGDFVPHEGDKVVYRSGTTGNLTTLTATFINNVWTGNLTTLEKGKGYVYISADTQTKTMVFMTDYEQ